MKQFSLDEYLKNPSRKVVTRDGRNVKITCTNYNSFHPLIAEIEGLECSESFTIEGKYYIPERDSQLDLFFATEKHEGWVNVYKAGNTPYSDTCIWPTEEEAKKWANDDYVATIKNRMGRIPMKTIKFKNKSSVGDTEHIFVTQNRDISGNMGYMVEILTLTKHPERYKHDHILRIFKGHAVILQSTFWSESTLREILEAIDVMKNQI